MAKILLVEDDNNLREIYGARLTAEGYTIVAAPDGEEALAIAVKEKPDLIITDVMMPKISGFDMLDILRNAPETKDTKIIMMTALSQAEDKERADKLGADLYLVKSQVTLEDVADSVRKILGGETAAPASTPTTGTASTDAPAAPSTALPTAADPIPEPTPEPPAPAAPMPTLSGQPAAPASVPTDTPAPQPSTPVAAPETDNSVAPAPTPEPSSDSSTPVAAPTEPTSPKKIEVALPDETPEPTATTPASETQPTETPPVASDTGSVGPNLAEALADEQKTITDQIKDFEETPAPSAATVIKPTVSSAPEATASPLTAGEEENPNKRIIQPLNDPTKGPDLDALVAKETEATADAPAPSATIEPDPSKVDGAQTSSQPNTPDKTDDFSKISL